MIRKAAELAFFLVLVLFTCTIITVMIIRSVEYVTRTYPTQSIELEEGGTVHVSVQSLDIICDLDLKIGLAVANGSNKKGADSKSRVAGMLSPNDYNRFCSPLEGD